MGLDRLHFDMILFALMIFVGVWLVIRGDKLAGSNKYR